MPQGLADSLRDAGPRAIAHRQEDDALPGTAEASMNSPMMLAISTASSAESFVGGSFP